MIFLKLRQKPRQRGRPNRAVPALVSAVRAVSSDHAVQAIALSNYVEALAHFVVGREKIQPFLDVCIWGDGPWEP